MILIKKGTPLPDLVALQQRAAAAGKSPKEAFEMLRNPLKEQVRTQLVEEQGELCAYCMCRIPRSDVPSDIPPIIIEHIIARNPADGRDAGQGLDYNNFLAVCHGNRGPHGTRTIIDLTCDAHRENAEFRKVNPMDESTLASIYYELDGTISSADPDVRGDLQETLNLNCPTSPILAERKAALEGLLESLDEVDMENLLGHCESSLAIYAAETTKKTPYMGIITWYLQDMIKSLREI